jgi:hypothetical protein
MDLVLNNVAVVEGFHVNIVSEALLLRVGIWYCGFDCSLRSGMIDNNVEVLKLTRNAGVVFIEYKRFSSYASITSAIPQSPAGILIYPTQSRTIRSRYRPSRDHAKPRTDSADIWHARAGHLGPKALQALVHSARNVKINGISRAQCESCSVAHAAQVISHRSPERKSPRPFFRIHWDLFDYPNAYNGAKWLLVIKDEYSGKLFGYVLWSKTLIDVFNSVTQFERWTKRQYGLSVSYIKHDNEKAVIAINGTTTYEKWAHHEGIELELAPTYTHEPNGAAERAGKEVIEKSIKMSQRACLPFDLWLKVTLTTIFLYNISSSEL